MGLDIEATALVGQGVRVWWDGENKFFQGQVTGFNATSWKHKVSLMREAFIPPPR